jgi:hypothetical protein
MVRPVIPDVEALTVDALKADTTLSTATGGRISTDLPATFPDGKRVALHRAGGSAADAKTEYLDRPVLQIECYGPTKADAFDCAAETIRALLDMQGGSYNRGVVGQVQRLTGPAWSPEPDGLYPRYLLSVAMHVHAP